MGIFVKMSEYACKPLPPIPEESDPESPVDKLASPYKLKLESCSDWEKKIPKRPPVNRPRLDTTPESGNSNFNPRMPPEKKMGKMGNSPRDSDCAPRSGGTPTQQSPYYYSQVQTGQPRGQRTQNSTTPRSQQRRRRSRDNRHPDRVPFCLQTTRGTCYCICNYFMWLIALSLLFFFIATMIVIWVGSKSGTCPRRTTSLAVPPANSVAQNPLLYESYRATDFPVPVENAVGEAYSQVENDWDSWFANNWKHIKDIWQFFIENCGLECLMRKLGIVVEPF